MVNFTVNATNITTVAVEESTKTGETILAIIGLIIIALIIIRKQK